MKTFPLLMVKVVRVMVTAETEAAAHTELADQSKEGAWDEAWRLADTRVYADIVGSTVQVVSTSARQP